MNTQQYGKTPSFDGIEIPNSMFSEYQVLADLISNPQYISQAKEYVSESMFSLEMNANTWRVITDMDINGESVDLANVASRVDKSVIVEIMSSRYQFGTWSPWQVIEHCTSLRNAWLRRTLYLRGLEIAKASSDMNSDINSLISMPGTLAEDVTKNARPDQSTKAIKDVLNDLSQEIEDNQINVRNGKLSRIPTGFRFLDQLTYSGFNAGNLVILSARPSVGKTAIMLFMAKSASRAGFASAIYSLEMTNQELGQRLILSTGLVTTKQIIEGNFDWQDIENANRQFSGLPLYLNDHSRTIDDIITDITICHNRGLCDIAYIDYLGLIPTNPRVNKTQGIAEITARLKQLAKICKIPIVLLCQLNRSSAFEDREPQLFDLRDSGSIEQDADIVLMLDRESKDISDPNLNIWVRKNRQGMVNAKIEVRANETFTEFTPR